MTIFLRLTIFSIEEVVFACKNAWAGGGWAHACHKLMHGRHRSGRRKRLQRVSGVMDLRWTVPLLSQTAAVHQDACGGSMKRLETRICEKWFVCQMLGVRCVAFETIASTTTG